jgi:hypothetical protein
VICTGAIAVAGCQRGVKPWPSFDNGGGVLSLVQPQSHVDTANAATHHCAFWPVG